MTTSNDHRKPDKGESEQLRIAIRTLAESVHRQGGLAGPVYSGVSSSDGIRLHRRLISILQERHPDTAVQAEVALKTSYRDGAIELLAGGRCDALLELPDGPLLIEVKSFSGPADRLPPAGEQVHWAQARLYAWAWLSDRPEIQAMSVGLAYLSADAADIIEIAQTFSRGELAGFFSQTCRDYLSFASDIIRSKALRDRSGLACRFPYPGLRAGQKRFMREVIGSAKQMASAFIQAPTGIGKTMASLYPAVKILANHLADHCFYLTNMTSTRLVAAAALDDLRRSGLTMKSIILYAKEKICLQPDLFCDSRQCQYATAY